MSNGAYLAARMACCCAAWVVIGQAAQTGLSLPQIRSVYVDSFGGKPGAQELRASLIAALEKSHKLKVASTPGQADAVLGGSGETWIRGYYSLNPRVRYVTSDAHAVYGGYLSVELKNSHEETLWSFLVTPRHFGPEPIDRNLAEQMAKKILAALAMSSGK